MRETEHLGPYNIKISFFITLLFYLNTSSNCQVYPDTYVDSSLKNGINSIIIQDYTQANKIFTELDTKYPRLPLGKIYLAAVQMAKSFDYGEDYNKILIDSLLHSAEEQSEQLLEENKNNIWNNYFLGLSEGYLAYFDALNEEWISSFSEGINALDAFNNVIYKDKYFYDALIAIGTFKYWKSRRTEFLNWLPGYNDGRKEGIKMLEEVTEHYSYNRYLAINSLIWINIDEKKYVKSVELAESALRKYPGSRFFMWGLARAYEDTDPVKSIEIYKQILNSLPINLNHYNEIVLKHLIAQQFSKIGNRQESLALCNDILSIRLNNTNVYKRLKNRLKKVRELKMELSR